MPTYTGLPTINVGDIPDATYFNTIRDDLEALRLGLGCRSYNSGGSISVPNTTATILTYNTDLYQYDAGAFHNTSSFPERFYVPVAGYYGISLHVSWPSNASGYRTAEIGWSNGSTSLIIAADSRSAFSGGGVDQSITTIYYMPYGTYVYARVSQSSGSTLSLTSTLNAFAIQLIARG